MSAEAEEDGLIQVAVRCKHENAPGKPCNGPLLKFFVQGIADITLTCPACRRPSRVLWQPLGVKVLPVSAK